MIGVHVICDMCLVAVRSSERIKKLPFKNGLASERGISALIFVRCSLCYTRLQAASARGQRNLGHTLSLCLPNIRILLGTYGTKRNWALATPLLPFVKDLGVFKASVGTGRRLGSTRKAPLCEAYVPHSGPRYRASGRFKCDVSASISTPN